MTPIPDPVRARAKDFLDDSTGEGAAILDRMARFVDLLLETNERMNLVRAKDLDEVWERHVFDSLSLLPWVDALDDQGVTGAVLDLGSGGGFPGIPLALARPNRRFVLVEATLKKADFLKSAVESLEIKNVQVFSKRAEDLGRDPSTRERYPLVVSRAVARMSVLLELALPLVEVGGVFLAMKGEKAEDELVGAKQALRLLGGEASIEPLDELFPGRKACVVQVDKVKRTQLAYPRPAGIPERKPLG